MEENNGFHDVIGNPAAPNLNYLARTFGVETDYFGVRPDSSESNYVGLLGGSVPGITSDDACDTKNVKPLTPLFAVTGSKTIATTPLPELNWPTPTPGAPPEPTSVTKATPSAGGWTVQQAQLHGKLLTSAPTAPRRCPFLVALETLG